MNENGTVESNEENESQSKHTVNHEVNTPTKGALIMTHLFSLFFLAMGFWGLVSTRESFFWQYSHGKMDAQNTIEFIFSLLFILAAFFAFMRKWRVAIKTVFLVIVLLCIIPFCLYFSSGLTQIMFVSVISAIPFLVVWALLLKKRLQETTPE